MYGKNERKTNAFLAQSVCVCVFFCDPGSLFPLFCMIRLCGAFTHLRTVLVTDVPVSVCRSRNPFLYQSHGIFKIEHRMQIIRIFVEASIRSKRKERCCRNKRIVLLLTIHCQKLYNLISLIFRLPLCYLILHPFPFAFGTIGCN